MISVAHQCPSVWPIVLMNAGYQCLLSAGYQCPSVLHISAVYQCPSVWPIVLMNAGCQCLLSAGYQCPSVQPHQRSSVKEKNHLFTNLY
ncbi:unnamed protein product, partial [Staurois parvus]